jgi:GT2 family glycosyltransferase
MPADGAVTAIIVGTGEPPDVLARLIASLRRQTLSPAQMVCVDQSPDGRYAVLADAPDSEVEVLGLRENLGYPSACNRGAQRATQEYLLFINPDAEADASCIAELHDALDARRDAVIAGAQVLLPDGRVNAGDNALHLTGLSWAGRYGLAPESGPPRPAAVVSGATLMVRRDAFEALGGYTEGFFMYYDDVDLAWRARLLGWEVLFCPSATLAHDYEFTKGSYKWTYLERNRWWCLLAHFERRTLLALTPLLLAVELAIWARAARERWLSAKLAGYTALWRDRRALLARRREIQSSRRVGDAEIVSRMTADVDSPFLDSPIVRHADRALRAYRRALLALLD